MRKALKQDFKLLSRSVRLINENQPRLIPTGIIHAVLTALFPFINIYMSALIVDRLADRNSKELMELAVITVLLNALFDIVRTAFIQLKAVQDSVFYNRQKQIMSNKTMTLDYESVEAAATHEKLRRVEDMHEITGMRLDTLPKTVSRMTEKLVSTIAAVIFVAGCFGTHGFVPVTAFQRIMASPAISVIFGAVVLGLLAAVVWVLLRQGGHHFRLYEDMLPINKIQWYYNREYLDSYRTGKEIRIFNQSGIIGKSYDAAMAGFNKISRNMGKAQGRFGAASRMCAMLSRCAIYLFVSMKALAGIFGVGSIVRYVGAITQLYKGVEGIIIDIVSTKQLLRWLYLFWDYMDTENVSYKGTLPVEKRSQCEGGDNEYKIEFHNVSFRYPGTDSYALKDVSLRLSIGQRLAAVGMNGSGKTTFIKLLCRLYDPTDGIITLNGIDIRKYRLREYMDIFGVVFQDYRLFPFTLGENVSTAVDYDGEQVFKALEAAGMGKRVCELENGLGTYLYGNFGEKGVEISGGEAQKIALARALYRNAPILVLDEPTAALDPVAEYEVYNKFNEIVGDRTAIYISHRLSSCRFCDNIAVFHEGRIIQRGSHDELVADKSGRYYELWHAQAQYYCAQ